MDEYRNGSFGDKNNERQWCDLEIKFDKGYIKMEEGVRLSMVVRGKLEMVASVKGGEECGFLEMNKCMSASRNHLSRSGFLRTEKMSKR
jgi:hypothetical protein